MPNPILKQNVLEWLSVMESQVIDIEHCFDSLSDLRVYSAVVDKDSGVNKIRLPFDFAAAQARQNAVGLHQPYAGLREPDAVPIPKRKRAADKIWVVENRVEAVGPIISRILVSLRKEKRSAKAQIIT